MFIWSKFICGILVSGRIMTCSTGMMVKRNDLVVEARDEAMMVVIAAMVSTGVSSMAMMIPLRNVDRQRGIRAAGVDAVHD